MSEFGDRLRKRTKDFALRIITMTEAMPRSAAGHVLSRQVLRSGTSIGANYREAYRARSGAEFLSKIGDCRKEIEETDYWLELIADARLLPTKKLEALRHEINELGALFTSIAKSKRRNL
jgi:four helix bundle protein